MALFKIFAIFALVSLAKGCQLNAQEGEKIGMQCAAKHPELFFEMTAKVDMTNPDSTKVLNVLCEHQSAVADIILCGLNKMGDCFPEAKPVMKLITSKDQWKKALKLVCKNKEILKDTCMEDNMAPFMTCYMGQLTKLEKSGLSGVSNPKDIVCKVIHSEENCLVANRGSCSNKYIQVLKDMLEAIFPVEDCTKPSVIQSSGKTDLANSLLHSILVHGEPQAADLKFKPYGKPYNKPYITNY